MLELSKRFLECVTIHLQPGDLILRHVGRDFGGTYSGHASEEDVELSENDARQRLASRAERVKMGDRNGVTAKDSGKNLAVRHAHAPRLGDAPGTGTDQGSDGGDEAEEDLDKAEEEDKSIRGSVY